MKVRPIIFSAPMVRALLDGRKVQTRRIAKFVPREPGYNLGFSAIEAGYYNGSNKASGFVLRSRGGSSGCWNDRTFPLHCPYGNPGDLLYVREACVNWRAGDAWKRRWLREADSTECLTSSSRDKPGRRASMHMPRSDSRLTLELTDVRVQRVQDISEEDAIAEGVEWSGERDGVTLYRPPRLPRPDVRSQPFQPTGLPAREAFGRLINKLRDGAWDRNAWMWALTFQVHKANVDKVQGLLSVERGFYEHAGPAP